MDVSNFGTGFVLQEWSSATQPDHHIHNKQQAVPRMTAFPTPSISGETIGTIRKVEALCAHYEIALEKSRANISRTKAYTDPLKAKAGTAIGVVRTKLISGNALFLKAAANATGIRVGPHERHINEAENEAIALWLDSIARPHELTPPTDEDLLRLDVVGYSGVNGATALHLKNTLEAHGRDIFTRALPGICIAHTDYGITHKWLQDLTARMMIVTNDIAAATESASLPPPFSNFAISHVGQMTAAIGLVYHACHLGLRLQSHSKCPIDCLARMKFAPPIPRDARLIACKDSLHPFASNESRARLLEDLPKMIADFEPLRPTLEFLGHSLKEQPT